MRSLGSLEAAIMDVLWSSPVPVTVAEVVNGLAASHPVAYTTAMTVLERLREKGRVERSKVGRSFRYFPGVTAEDYVSGLLAKALDEASDRLAVLVRFAGTLTKSEADALQRALAETSNDVER